MASGPSRSIRLRLRNAGGGNRGRRAVNPGELGLGLIDPLLELFLRYRLNGNRHEAVILPAKFRALAVVNPLALDPDPGFIDPAGNRVALDAKGRHRPG